MRVDRLLLASFGGSDNDSDKIRAKPKTNLARVPRATRRFKIRLAIWDMFDGKKQKSQKEAIGWPAMSPAQVRLFDLKRERTPLQHLAVEMELDNAGRVQDEQLLIREANISPFLTSSRPPPPQWELNEADFLLPGPIRHSTQDSMLFVDTKPLLCRSGPGWQDQYLSLTACETVPNALSFFNDDEIFAEKAAPSTLGKLMPSVKLRVSATEFHDLHCSSYYSVSHGSPFRDEPSVLSPTMLDKKILVTDSDLKLFSTSSSSIGNMRALSTRESSTETSSRFKRDKLFPHVKRPTGPTATKRFVTATTLNRKTKRRASLKANSSDHVLRASKHFQIGSNEYQLDRLVPSLGFQAMLPRLSDSVKPTQHYDSTGFLRPVLHQVDVQQQKQEWSAPKHKIGIYPPAERRERLRRFHEKRKHRVYHKRIKYACRKLLANACPRVKGRFVRKAEVHEATSAGAASEASSTPASEP
ncbi:hypothetical protein BBJ28_00000539 [Nothophytophthora sp. Chile5]|nr:hypothetical protein BBJ28_00000539 [Nothophytophthora sp. Chile5]